MKRPSAKAHLICTFICTWHYLKCKIIEYDTLGCLWELSVTGREFNSIDVTWRWSSAVKTTALVNRKLKYLSGNFF